ncbi:MAG: hypothetical protein IT168_13840 [Bryobacterales bacterium]|nr:hypothetical protein [Bryobacterales bacterium]
MSTIMGARRQPEFGSWHVPGRSPVIVYSQALLCELAAEVLEGFQAFSPSGYEIGGILFGTADEEEIRITGARRIPCEHRFGPEFLLSAQDEASMQHLLSTYMRDGTMEGLAPVGWFRSRSKGELELSDTDVLLWNRFFPQPSQVTLVMRPGDGGTVQAGFFWRPAEGPVLRKTPLPFTVGAEPSSNPDLSGPAPFPPGTPLPPAKLPAELPAELMVSPQPGANKKKIMAAGLAVAILALGAYLGYMTRRQTPPPLPDLGLRIVEQSGQVRVVWNATSGAVRQARTAKLEIGEGRDAASFSLDPALLQIGFWGIPRAPTDLVVRLHVDSPLTAQPLVEVARYVSARLPKQPEPATDPSAARALQDEIGRLQTELQDRVTRNGRLQEQVAKAQQAATPKAPPPAASVQAEPANGTTAAAPQAPVSPPPANSAPPTTAVTPAQLPPPPPPEPASTAPVYTGPMSGRMIWTGVLPAGGTLTVDGRKASAGTLSGGLPGVNVRVAAYPAEFSAGGLTVYSAAQRYANGGVTEARSAQNGWMATKYVYDPARAQDLAVAEAPSPGNSFRRLVIRGGSRPVQAVVIAWEVVQ